MFCLYLLSLIGSVHYSDDLTHVFESIYETCEWGKNELLEGTSGSGSEFKNVQPYFNFLQTFLKENKIQSVVDAGCGDWQFSQFINWSGINYQGFDASKTVIKKNQEKFASKTITFVHGNFLERDLPKADLLILKDVLQHLSSKNIKKAISQFKNYKYVIVVNDVDPINLSAPNIEIKDGQYRPLDITSAPYNVKAEKVLTYKVPHSHEVKQTLLIKDITP